MTARQRLIKSTLESWDKAKPYDFDPDFYQRVSVGHLYELGYYEELCSQWGRPKL